MSDLNSNLKQFNKKPLIYGLAESKVASNVLLLLMFIVGFWGISKMNTQFFPKITLEIINVIVLWNGANAEDVESSLTKPIENALKNLVNLEKYSSKSALGYSNISLVFKEGADMAKALEDIDQKISMIKNLPKEAEEPIVQRSEIFETFGEIVVASERLTQNELHIIANEIEADLLAAGIEKVSFSGLPKMEIAIEVKPENLQKYQLTLADINAQINNNSLDSPVGSVLDKYTGRDIRVIQQAHSDIDYRTIPIRTIDNQNLTLGDIATITLKPIDGSESVKLGSKRAVILDLQRLESGSTIQSANVLKKWQKTNMPAYQKRATVQIYNKRWQHLEQRIRLLIHNGLSGLVLVILVLLLFMNVRIALWIAVGIPASLMLTFGVFYLIGGSINMISLFSFIMTLGIIVDDAIIVGEHAVYQFEQGKSPLEAAYSGANRMFFPVLAASLTTLVAFFPLTLLTGVMGKFLITIPMVVICVLIASLLECFLVLPGHLNHTFASTQKKQKKEHVLRQCINQLINHFRDKVYRRFVRRCLENRAIVIVLSVTCLVVGLTLVSSGRVAFVFFPNIESSKLSLNVTFTSGTPQQIIVSYLESAEDKLNDTNQDFGGKIVVISTKKVGGNTPYKGLIKVELTDPDKRTVSNKEFIKKWRQKIPKVSGVEKLNISAGRTGPRGQAISFQLFSNDIFKLKEASLEFATLLRQLPGVSNVADNMSYGKNQISMKLTPLAKNLNLQIREISRQIGNSYNGILSQVITLNNNDVDVRLKLTDSFRNKVDTLNSLYIQLPNKQFVPLTNLVTWETRRGFDEISHYNGLISSNVFGDLDTDKATLSELMVTIKSDMLPQLQSKYGVSWKAEGTSKNQAEAMKNLMTGLIIGLVLIYVLLVWVFNSWGWPIVILVTIPFGLFGAIIGHMILGINLSIMSIFGMFALSGIVINDSIVLITTYREYRTLGGDFMKTLVDSSCLRLRAVLLTSVTTALGLTPLLFETSLQAQFLIPMAATLAFGLIFATFLILILVPTLLSFYEEVQEFIDKKRLTSE